MKIDAMLDQTSITTMSDCEITNVSDYEMVNDDNIIDQVQTVRIGRRRHNSDPLHKNELRAQHMEKDDLTMMSILLDIRARIHNLEMKGDDMITNASLPHAMTRVQKPMIEEINNLKSTVKRHEERDTSQMPNVSIPPDHTLYKLK